MTLDLKAISQDPLRLLVFFGLLLIVRGLPSLLVYRRALPARQRVEMTFITATTLPLLIALAEIGQRDGVMLPATVAALVGAGVLSVLVFPLVAVGCTGQRGSPRPMWGSPRRIPPPGPARRRTPPLTGDAAFGRACRDPACSGRTAGTAL